MTVKAYYGTNGQPVNTAYGWHKEKYYYKSGSQYKCELFDASNRKISTAYMVNNNWKFQTSGGAKYNNAYDWKAGWKALAKECPANSGDGVIIETVTVNSNSVMLEIVFENYSSEELKAKAMEVGQALKDFLRKKIYTPTHVEIIIVFYDQNHDRVTAI